MLVSVLYNNGKACNIQAEPAGSADSDKTCASKGTVELVNGALIFTTAVLGCEGGEWRNPKYVAGRKSLTQSGRYEGGYYMRDGCTSWSEETALDCHSRYVLMSAEELKGAASVTIDGVLMFAAEDGRLASVMGGDTRGSSEGPQLEKLRKTASTGSAAFRKVSVPETSCGLNEGRFNKVSGKSGGMSK